MAKKLCDFGFDIKSLIVMVIIKAIPAGLNILYKLAVIEGMSLRVLIAYRYTFATVIVIPLALIFERNRPRMTWMIAFQGFLCGLFGGALAQNLFIEALALTSTIFVTSMYNIIPALTFVLTILFRLERLGIRKISGVAKFVGTLLGVGGAMILSFYKGREINIWSTNINLTPSNKYQIATSHHVLGNQILGSVLSLTSCLCAAIWFIIQAKMSERYPCKFSSTALMCSTSAIQATIYAICFERESSAWKLGWNMRLLIVAYSGIFATAGTVAILSWYVHKMGPLFVSSFSPLVLIYVAVVGSLCLGEKLHVGRSPKGAGLVPGVTRFSRGHAEFSAGSEAYGDGFACLLPVASRLIGTILIIIGLYAVIWGKSKEKKKTTTAQAAGHESLEVAIDGHQLANSGVVCPIDHQTAVELSAVNGKR